MDLESRVFFTAFLLLLALQRFVELSFSRRNLRAAMASGAREAAPGQAFWMTLMHAAWFFSCAMEVWAPRLFSFDSSKAGFASGVFYLPAFFAGLLLTCAGQILRYAAMRALGPRWNVRIIVFPGRPPVASGIYQYLRHPNYLGVVLEIAGVPLLHGAWITAVLFSLLNGIFLYFRIRAEERAVYG